MIIYVMENKKQIGLWKDQNKIFKTDTSNNNIYIKKFIFPSGRNCIIQYLKEKNFSRNNYIVIQEYMGFCVLNSINKVATTVPFNFINSNNIKHTNTILIYNQWGWEKSQEKINELKDKFKNIILDRVDTLIDYTNDKNHYKNVDCEIFSLNKTLGLGGGGLLWIKDKYIKFLNKKKTIQEQILVDHINDTEYSNYDFIDHLLKNNFQTYSKKLQVNISTLDINRIVSFEIKCRKMNLALLIKSFNQYLPDWMLKINKDNGTFPGIFPLRLKDKSKYDLIINKMKYEFDIDSTVLNFNFSDNYLDYRWEKVIPIPLHSDISLETLKLLIKLIKNLIE